MLVLNTHKIIFIHIHKTGGSSVEASLEPLLRWNDILLGSTPWGESANRLYLERFGLEKHSPAWWVREVVGDDVWGRYFTWATVRQPYARVVSLYNFLASLAVPLFAEVGYPEHEAQEVQRAWLEAGAYSGQEPWCYPGVRAFLATRSLRRPFSEFLRHPDLAEEPGFAPQFAQVSDRAQQEVIVKRIVRLEQLDAFWPEFRALNRLGDAPLVVANVTDSRFRQPVSALLQFRDDLDLINRIYADDFRRFGYEPV